MSTSAEETTKQAMAKTLPKGMPPLPGAKPVTLPKGMPPIPGQMKAVFDASETGKTHGVKSVNATDSMQQKPHEAAGERAEVNGKKKSDGVSNGVAHQFVGVGSSSATAAMVHDTTKVEVELKPAQVSSTPANDGALVKQAQGSPLRDRATTVDQPSEQLMESQPQQMTGQEQKKRDTTLRPTGNLGRSSPNQTARAGVSSRPSREAAAESPAVQQQKKVITSTTSPPSQQTHNLKSSPTPSDADTRKHHHQLKSHKRSRSPARRERDGKRRHSRRRSSSGSSSDSRRSRDKDYRRKDRHRSSSKKPRRDDSYDRERERHQSSRRDRHRRSKDRSPARYRDERRRRDSGSSERTLNRQSKHHRSKSRHRSNSSNSSRNSGSYNRRSRHQQSNRKHAGRDRHRQGGKPQRTRDALDDMASHPYFQKRNPNQAGASKKNQEAAADNGAEGELFWDGFQWVPRQRQKAYFNPMQENMIAKVVEVSGADKTKNMERVANSRTLIVDNVPLDFGMTSKELQKFFLDELTAKGITSVYIVDIDAQAGGQNNSIQVELANQEMIEQFRQLDQTTCLGETLKIRRIGEETTQTNAQAAVIALNALQEITRGGRTKAKDQQARGAVNKAELEEGIEGEGSELEETGVPGGALGLNAVSLKTLTPSRYVKISNVWNRDFDLAEDARKELEEDFKEELHSVTKFKSLTVITKESVKLGAELGSIFVEFWNDKTSQQGVKKVKGRIYDGCEIKTCYIEETLFNQHFFPQTALAEAADEADSVQGAPKAAEDVPMATAAQETELAAARQTQE